MLCQMAPSFCEADVFKRCTVEFARKCSAGAHLTEALATEKEEKELSQKIEIPAHYLGYRLDRALSSLLPGVSRRIAREWCEAGCVRVGSSQARSGTLLQGGEIVEVTQQEDDSAASPEVPQESGSILFEDEFILVYEKPRGMHSVRHRDEDPKTAADELLDMRPALQSVSPDEREAGLVQRLDQWTSGCLVAAKTRDAWERLRQSQAHGEWRKTYLMLVEGKVPWLEEMVDSPIMLRKGATRVYPEPPGRLRGNLIEAETMFTALGHLSIKSRPMTILRAELDKATRHQVRFHASHIGFPLVGDTQYGAHSSLRGVQSLVNPDGFLLHAESITFPHPIKGDAMEIESTNAVFAGLLSASS